MKRSMKEILKNAKKGHYGVCAPNCFNFESIQACFEAANELKAPIILDVGAVHDIEAMAAIVDFHEKRYPNVVFALNLDHGGAFEDIMLAIQSDFSSVMIDRSTESLEINIKETQEIVKIAHALGVSVEAELGHVGQGVHYEKQRNQGLTNLEDAVRFVRETDVDCLAIAIGTSHGSYQGKPYLDFDLLKNLRDHLDLPLVLHGGSATGDDNLKKAVALGIQKINLFTDLGEAWIEELGLLLQNKDSEKVQKDARFSNQKRTIFSMLQASARHGYKDKLMHYMRLLGSENKVL